MSKKKLRKRQAEGLFLISQGMETQLNFLKNRLAAETDNFTKGAARVLEYWLNEVELALKGEKHL